MNTQNAPRFCPKCGAAIQEQARFCLHCMTPLDSKQRLEPRRRIGRRARIAIIVAAALIAAAAATFAVVYFVSGGAPENTVARDFDGDYGTVCSFDTFSAAVAAASAHMGLDSLWDAGGFRDAYRVTDAELTVYSTDMHLGDALIYAGFYNGGEYLLVTVADAAPEDEESAVALLSCVCSAALNYYVDLSEVTASPLYPPSEYGLPYFPDSAHMMRREDEYDAAVADGARFATTYVFTKPEGEDDIFCDYLCTERDYGGAVRVDHTLLIDHTRAYPAMRSNDRD